MSLDALTPLVTKPVNVPINPLPAEVEALVVQAEGAIGRGNFAGVLIPLDRAAEAVNHPRIAKDLGLAYLGLGNRLRALEYLTRAEHTAGDDVLLQLLLGQLQASAGQTEQALVTLRRALLCTGAKPEDPLTGEVMLSLGELLARNGYLAAAEECLARLYDWIGRHGRSYAARPRLRPLVVQPDRLLVRRGELLLHLGRAAEARDVLRQAIARDRTNMQAVELLLQAHLAAKDFAAAEKLLLDIAAEPTARTRLPHLAEKLCQGAQDPSMPARIWRASRRQAVDVGALAVALAQAAEKLQAPKAAQQIIDSALETMPNDVAVNRYVAEQYARSGDAAAAVRQLATLLAADDQIVETVDETMESLADEGLLPEGLEDRLARQAAEEPSDLKGVLHYLAGRLAEIRANTDLAAQQYQAAVEDEELFLPAYEAAANLYLEAGWTDRVDRLLARLNRLAEADVALRYYALYLEGKNYLAQGRLADAAGALKASFDENDDFPAALDMLAEVYGRLGRADQAVGTLEELLKRQPEDESVYHRLFDLYLAMGRIDQARSAMVRLLQNRPQSRTGQAMLAELLLLTGKTEEGTGVLEELGHQAGDDPVVQLLTLRLAAGSTEGAVPKQQFDDWMARLGKVLAQDPYSLPARRLLSELLIRAGRHTQACAVLGELYEENPGLPNLAKAYVLELVQSGDTSAAQAILEGNPFLQKDPQSRQWLLQVLLEKGRWEEAARRLREWLGGVKERPFQDFCRLQLLNVYEKMRDFSAAQRQIDELLVANPSQEMRISLQATRVRLLCLEGKVPQAVALAKAWTGRESQADLKLALASALAKAGRDREAQGLLDGWIRRGEADQDLLAEGKMILWIQAKKQETVLRYAQAWIKRSPAALAPRRIAVAALMDAQDYDRALKLVDGWLERFDSMKSSTQPAATQTQPGSRPSTATAAVSTGTKAVRPLQTAPASQNPSSQATSDVAGPTTPPMTTSAFSPIWTIQSVWERLGAMPAAKAPQAKELAAVRSWCREIAVHVLVTKGQFSQALERVSAYLQAEPNNVQLLSLQSSALSELGRHQEALAALEQAHALASDDAGLSNNLGYLCADMGVHLAKAEGLIRQALAARSDEKDFQDSLGWVLYKQGKLSAAGGVFERLLEGGKAIWPTCAISYDHAGDVYYRLGWTERAAEFWAQAVAHARREGRVDRDTRRILTEGPGKVQAAQTGQTPAVAPLGSFDKVDKFDKFDKRVQEPPEP